MSTKVKKKRLKLYSLIDFEEARINSEKVRNYYSRKNKKRETLQIRIDKEWHKKIKDIANKKQMVMSVMLDKICKHFFKYYGED